MPSSKMNIGLSLSRNFNKVTLEMIEEPVEYESEEELRARVRQKFAILREEVDLEFTKMAR